MFQKISQHRNAVASDWTLWYPSLHWRLFTTILAGTDVCQRLHVQFKQYIRYLQDEEHWERA